jgi:hypothetical protein
MDRGSVDELVSIELNHFAAFWWRGGDLELSKCRKCTFYSQIHYSTNRNELN